MERHNCGKEETSNDDDSSTESEEKCRAVVTVRHDTSNSRQACTKRTLGTQDGAGHSGQMGGDSSAE